MDRLDAWTTFAAVAEARSFAAAARRLGRSPAAVTRAVAALEERVGARLLTRTTRSVALTDAGARSLEAARRALAWFEELEGVAAAGRQEPRGRLGVTASVVFGRLHVLPIVQAFLRDHPSANVELLLLDRVVSLVDEGLDVAVRLGRLPDSSLRALRAGEVRRAVYASPGYLRASGTPRTPQALASHACVACTAVTPVRDRWTFERDGRSFVVPVSPRLVVNTAEAAIDAAVAGLGPTCVLSYMVDAHVRAGRLQRILGPYEPPAVPVQVVIPAGRFVTPLVRAFVDRAVEALRVTLGALAA
ncbi:LysR substrate-binding domain-containing protein [Anaeromyxobacter terrae]|uniref:LysR substrate-binding domain-containing protein n=1 Tax=Anaeromyxobacter terrae TaxID=2925406 RepID=UPI001F57851D|nr:LysR substrate-binding domain-containing protein [Anaeromyxobacter sp. SG22]